MSLPEHSDAQRLAGELAKLQGHLEDLAAGGDDDLARYALVRPPMPPGLYWRARWVAGRVLRWLEAVHLKRPDPFPPGLKTTPGNERDRPLLVWAIGADRETLRAACRQLAETPIGSRGFAPVLVTDVADFAFFSRLGWLVEYIPDLAGTGQSYRERKLGLIARLYRDAPVLPASAAAGSWREIRTWLTSIAADRAR